MLTLSSIGIALIPVTIGLVAIAKMYIDSRYAPLMSLAFGLILAALVPNVEADGSMILGGLIIGLSASGVYSGVKAMVS